MLPARTLTFQFDRVVSADGVTPEEWEVVVTPLADQLNGTTPDSTLVGTQGKKAIVLSAALNEVEFDVVPSDAPGLPHTQWYRAAWRPKFFGKMTVRDFTMPDMDVKFKDLQDLGRIIDSEVYLRQADVGTHVAGLDAEGYVLDGAGNRVGIDNTPAIALINQEKIDRQTADNSLRQNLESMIIDQVTQTLSTATTRINNAVSALEEVDISEAGIRASAVATLNSTLASIQNGVIADLSEAVAAHTAALPLKADLVDGKLVSSQLSALSLTTAVAVANQSAMLALNTNQVQPGDLAIRPDGSYLLLAYPTATLANWIKISTGGNVLSVNGEVGAVVLNAANVGAIAIGAMIDQSQITGLAAALTAKAATTVTDGLNTRLLTIENDTTLVRTVSSLIVKSLLPTDSVFVNGSNQLVKKNGDIISLGGGGGPVDWDNLVDVPATFPPTIGSTGSTAVAGNDARLTNARTPTAHAASHGSGAGDALTLAITQVTDLDDTLEEYGNRINTLEGLGGGGGASSPVKSLWFDGVAVTGITDISDFQAEDVLQKSPFGQADDNSYYYNPDGADNDEWRWPVLTPNGHLKLVKWDETAPVDPVMATAASVTDLADDLALKADTTTVTALTSAVGLKASTTYVDAADNTLLTALNLKASITAMNLKADTSTVTALASDVSDLEEEMALKATIAALGNKADTTTVNTALGLKADLVTGKVPNAQLRDDIPATKISGLPAVLTSKADLVSGTVPLSQMSQVIPQNYIVGLGTSFAGKADLVGGKVPTSQMPTFATHETYAVSNRAGMLALTTTQVQIGDVAIITATADKGTYTLIATDPTSFANWMKHQQPDDLVSSVNGQTGPVVLSAANVGARSATDPIAQADITGLTASFAAKADAAATTAALATKTSAADVQTVVSQAAPPGVVALIATANLSLSGTPSIDGTLTTVGMRVLVTAQASSINNGIYVVAAGTWARATDLNGPTPSNPGISGNYFVRGTSVIVTGGTANHDTIWQQTSASGVVGTNANNWSKTLTAGPPLTYTAANNSGLTITDTAIVVKNTTGIAVTTAGVGVDHTKVPFIYTGDVPAGSTSATIPHMLNTLRIASVSVRDKTSGAVSLVGWNTSGSNAIVIEFGVAPTTGQYDVTVLG